MTSSTFEEVSIKSYTGGVSAMWDKKKENN